MKYNSTKFEGVQFQDERAPLDVRVLRHEDVVLRSNLEKTSKVVLHLLVRLGAREM